MFTELQPQGESYRRRNIQKLFSLCDAWLAGTMRDDVFLGESLALRKTLLAEEWGTDLHPRRNRLFRSFNLAVECSIAVEHTIVDLEQLAQSNSPPFSVRAYYFAKRVNEQVILELERFLSLTPDVN